MKKIILLFTLALLMIGCKEAENVSFEEKSDVLLQVETAVTDSISSDTMIFSKQVTEVVKDLSIDDVVLKEAYQLSIGGHDIYVSDVTLVEDIIEILLSDTAKNYDCSVDVTVTKALEVITYIDSESILEIGLLEGIDVKSVKVNSGILSEVEDAVELLKTPYQDMTSYEVKSGDVPSLIAEQFEMGLSELYTLNPGLEKKTQSLQIGESIVIQEEKMLANVYVIMEKSYEESIPKGYTYVTNPEKYEGSQSTMSYGNDGVKTVLSRVKIVADETVSEEILKEAVVFEPQNAVISRGTRALPAKGAIGNFVYPVEDYKLTSGYGLRWNRKHRGIDMAVMTGTTVMASDGGVVTIAGWNNSYGYYVEIDHGYAKTRYAHNSRLLVSVGQVVSQYEVISYSGNTGNSTGPHLHFEIIIDDVWVNPLDYLN